MNMSDFVCVLDEIPFLKTYWEWRYSCKHFLRRQWMGVASFTSRPLYFRWENLDKKVRVPQSRYGLCSG